MPELVDDELVAANAVLWTVAVVAQTVLAPLAGLVIAAAGVGWTFGFNAASFVVPALLLVRHRSGRTLAVLAVTGWPGMRDGVSAVPRHPLLARLAVVQVLASLSAGLALASLAARAVARRVATTVRRSISTLEGARCAIDPFLPLS